MNLLLLEADECTHDRVTLRGARADHLRHVLGVTVGSAVRAGIVDGPLGTATVVAVEPGGVQIECAFNTATPERPRVDLLLALPRPKVLRRLWPQIAALGVGRIMLTNAARVERNYFDTHLLGEAIYRPLLVEGLQQARDTRLPIVSVHRQLKVFLEDMLQTADGTRRLFADPHEGRHPRRLLTPAPPQVLLAVGPEGGWTEYEHGMLSAHGFSATTLGPRTLRSDTACVALLAVVHAALDARGD